MGNTTLAVFSNDHVADIEHNGELGVEITGAMHRVFNKDARVNLGGGVQVIYGAHADDHVITVMHGNTVRVLGASFSLEHALRAWIERDPAARTAMERALAATT